MIIPEMIDVQSRRKSSEGVGGPAGLAASLQERYTLTYEDMRQGSHVAEVGSMEKKLGRQTWCCKLDQGSPSSQLSHLTPHPNLGLTEWLQDRPPSPPHPPRIWTHRLTCQAAGSDPDL